MFAVLHSDINSLKSGLLFNQTAYSKKSRSAKAKDGIINLILRNYLINFILRNYLVDKCNGLYYKQDHNNNWWLYDCK